MEEGREARVPISWMEVWYRVYKISALWLRSRPVSRPFGQASWEELTVDTWVPLRPFAPDGSVVSSLSHSQQTQGKPSTLLDF